MIRTLVCQNIYAGQYLLNFLPLNVPVYKSNMIEPFIKIVPPKISPKSLQIYDIIFVFQLLDVQHKTGETLELSMQC